MRSSVVLAYSGTSRAVQAESKPVCATRSGLTTWLMSTTAKSSRVRIWQHDPSSVTLDCLNDLVLFGTAMMAGMRVSRALASNVEADEPVTAPAS